MKRKKILPIAAPVVIVVIAVVGFSSSAPARLPPSAKESLLSSGLRAHSATSSHLQVTEVEYRLILSRGVVRAGPVDLEAIDGGMDPHDLRLRHRNPGREIAAPELTSKRRWDGVVRLQPGVYHLWCSLPEHAKLGMHATLRVVG